MRATADIDRQLMEHLRDMYQLLQDAGCNHAEVKEYLLGIVMLFFTKMDGLITWVASTFIS